MLRHGFPVRFRDPSFSLNEFASVDWAWWRPNCVKYPMLSIARLIETAEPIDAATPCDAAVDVFLQPPGGDLVAVLERGRLVGVVTHEAVRGRPAGEPVSNWMSAPVTVEAGLEVDRACQILLSQAAPCPGLV